MVIVFFLSFLVLFSCSLVKDYENDTMRIEFEEEEYNKLRNSGDYYIYNWDITMDSLLCLREKYKSHLKITRKGLDYLVYPYRHYSGRWGTQEFRFRENKLYKIIEQWNNRGKFEMTKIATLLTGEPDFKSDILLDLNAGLEGENGIYERLEYPPHSILCRWHLKKMTHEILFEKNVEKKDNYNYYEINTKPD